MWWIESNWTYNGMFDGEEPGEMFEKLSGYGAMGSQIKEVTQDHSWANLKTMYNYNKRTLGKERGEMYRCLLRKLNNLYLK